MAFFRELIIAYPEEKRAISHKGWLFLVNVDMNYEMTSRNAILVRPNVNNHTRKKILWHIVLLILAFFAEPANQNAL